VINAARLNLMAWKLYLEGIADAGDAGILTA
jgi:hypothetical protein